MRAIAIVLALSATIAHAEPLSQLSGRVLDRASGAAVEGALVVVTGPKATRTLTTDLEGRYAIIVGAGHYSITFAYGKAKSVAAVDITDQDATLDAKLDAGPGEVIVIR